MKKPIALVAPHFRTIDELFSKTDWERLSELCTLQWAVNDPIPQETFEHYLETAHFIVGVNPQINRGLIEKAANLQAILEVAGGFPKDIDYDSCFDRNIHVLSCAPAFREIVAEMTLGFLISGGRGIVEEHEAFRKGNEHWLGEDKNFDFMLYRQTIGFLGFGSIARECARLLRPFGCNILVYDPWLPEETAKSLGVTLCDLNTLYQKSRALVIAASPTSENYQLVDQQAFQTMQRGTLVVLISRSHLVDFEALTQAVLNQQIRAAIDVFPQEPFPQDHPLRHMSNVILSPHRAAAVYHGRHTIGKMVVNDIEAILQGKPPTAMQKALTKTVYQRIGAEKAAKQ